VKVERQKRFRATAAVVTPAVAAYLARRQYPMSKTDLEDLVEEVLIIVWRRLDDIPQGAEIPWSIGVARNVRRNAVRKLYNGQAATDQLRPATATASAEDSYLADEGVRSALAALHDDDRDLLLLHFWDGLRADEIAVILGISANAAAVRLSRAQERFRHHFEVSNVG
jgi:RNA polymerase sigma-70 factor (ECF subfamily)